MFRLIRICVGNREMFHYEHRIFNGMVLMASLAALGATIVNITLNLGGMLTAVTGFSSVALLFLFYLSRYKNMFYVSISPVAFIVAVTLSAAYFFNGGIDGPVPMLFLAPILVFSIIIKGKRNFYPIVFFSGILLLLFFVEYLYPELVIRYNSRMGRFLDVAVSEFFAIVLTTVAVTFVVNYYHYENHRSREAKQKADDLLLNILPGKVAMELQEKGKVTPEEYDLVTIMFTDFKDFTDLVHKGESENLVYKLDTIFSEFDRLIDKYGLEKIKTIGDGYMCAGGLPESNKTHAIDVCLAALEILFFVKTLNEVKYMFNKERFWGIRIGIHTGSATAGVIGKKKFSYDIWGDAVNVASRMESHGKTGKISISEDTYHMVKHYFDCEIRGNVKIKNRGIKKIYHLTRLKSKFSRDRDGIVPNEFFLNEYKKKLPESGIIHFMVSAVFHIWKSLLKLSPNNPE